MNPPSFSRLHLGASRFDRLERRVLPWFQGREWLHYGEDAPVRTVPRWLAPLAGWRRRRQGRPSPAEAARCHESTRFEPWVYRKGDRLDHADATFSLIFAEHFFEHLFFDEAMALFRECRRVLRPGGVLRVVVPDADLRTYEKPEPAGYPDPRMPFTHPQKHRTRWSVYMLCEALAAADLAPHPLVYCTLDGRFVEVAPETRRTCHADTADPLVFTLDYVQRRRSLIADGIRS